MITTQTIGATQSSVAAAGKTILGKDDFFKMLLAQLKNQNPLEPLDGTAFAAQLAQFSSLEQLQNLNNELKTLSNNQAVMIRSYAIGLIGKEVEADISGEQYQETGYETVTGVVTGIRMKDNSIYLSLGGLDVNLKDVISVK
ncbi:MAG: flagellar hook capping FlgD N-terminal domain-containing protein [Smithellaceae bacterium]|nr:flagellar hook capping FlgD N-terminal domain-containing protein [Smithellaceae bacterium]